MQGSTPAIFNEPTAAGFNEPLAPNVVPIFNPSNEPMKTNSSIFIDLECPIFNNISEEIKMLSFSDFAMDSFSKTDDVKPAERDNK